MSWYRMFQILIWYMIWYLFDTCLVSKMAKKLNMTGNVWSDFTYFGICTVYKKSGIWTDKRLFSLYHQYIQYQRLWEMNRNDYFWLVCGQYVMLWYTYNNLFLLQNTIGLLRMIYGTLHPILFTLSVPFTAICKRRSFDGKTEWIKTKILK